ncbi:MAG: competence/damage-inducible protein A [Candidatus Melainabacteria bacterium]
MPLTAEIIAVGTELLLGDVINSNAAWLSRELAALGIHVYHHVTVGDNPARIQAVIDHALTRKTQPANLLLFTGGLGPTDDDLTVATLADYFNATLVADPDSEASIRQFFVARGQPMSASNIKQALKPTDAVTVANPLGTAPGIFWELTPGAHPHVTQPTLIATFPGVPKELTVMWPAVRDHLLAFQEKHRMPVQRLFTRFLHFFGIGESKLGELLSDLMEQDNPTVAPYVGNAQVRIRVVARAATQAEADALIAPVEAEILRRCGQYYFGRDEDTLEGTVGEQLRRSNLTLAVAESCTGGLVSSRLTDVPGSSDYIRLNAVTYSNDQKTALLGVPEATLAAFGAVSAETAEAMAMGIRRLSGCDIGLSLTGIAGPDGGAPDKPVGLLYIGLATPDGQVTHEKVLVNSRNKRTDMKFWFSQYALHTVRQWLQDHPEKKSDALTSETLSL